MFFRQVELKYFVYNIDYLSLKTFLVNYFCFSKLVYNNNFSKHEKKNIYFFLFFLNY